MPRLNARLDVLMGLGGSTLSVNQIPWATGGGGDWCTNTTVVAQILDGAWYVAALTSPTSRTAVTTPPHPANTVYAGGGQWASWSLAAGVQTSRGNPWGVNLTKAGLHAVGADGTIIITPDYQIGRDLWLLRPNGSVVKLAVGPARAVQMPAADVVLWTAGDRLGWWGLPLAQVVDEPLFNPRACQLPSGEWWLSYHTDDRWLLQPWTEAKGYVLQNAPGTFRPDVGVIDATTLLCVAAASEGEGPTTLIRRTQSLAAPRVPLEKGTPPPIPPVEPPIPPPTEPIPPIPPTRPPVAFPSDAEFTDFTAKLEQLYAGEMQRPAETTHVDPLGRGRWTYDYALHRQAGLSHVAAWAKVDAEIRRIAGLPPNP